MDRLPRQKYTKEFREQAVRVVREQKLTLPEAARRLAMSEKTLANWVFRARHGQLAELDDSRRPVTELEAEVSRLKREQDLFTCEVVGHAMDARMTTDLMWGALRKALTIKRPAPGLLHHSDRSVQGGFNRSTQHL
jgi:transposase